MSIFLTSWNRVTVKHQWYKQSSIVCILELFINRLWYQSISPYTRSLNSSMESVISLLTISNAFQYSTHKEWNGKLKKKLTMNELKTRHIWPELMSRPAPEFRILSSRQNNESTIKHFILWRRHRWENPSQ